MSAPHERPVTWVPSSKLQAAGITGAVLFVTSYVLSTYAHVDVPEEVWMALVGIGTWAGGYLKTERRQVG